MAGLRILTIHPSWVCGDRIRNDIIKYGYSNSSRDTKYAFTTYCYLIGAVDKWSVSGFTINNLMLSLENHIWKIFELCDPKYQPINICQFLPNRRGTSLRFDLPPYEKYNQQELFTMWLIRIANIEMSCWVLEFDVLLRTIMNQVTTNLELTIQLFDNQQRNREIRSIVRYSEIKTFVMILKRRGFPKEICRLIWIEYFSE